MIMEYMVFLTPVPSGTLKSVLFIASLLYTMGKIHVLEEMT